MDLPYLFDMLSDCVDLGRSEGLVIESDAVTALAWIEKQQEAFNQLQPIETEYLGGKINGGS